MLKSTKSHANAMNYIVVLQRWEHTGHLPPTSEETFAMFVDRTLANEFARKLYNMTPGGRRVQIIDARTDTLVARYACGSNWIMV